MQDSAGALSGSHPNRIIVQSPGLKTRDFRNTAKRFKNTHMLSSLMTIDSFVCGKKTTLPLSDRTFGSPP